MIFSPVRDHLPVEVKEKKTIARKKDLKVLVASDGDEYVLEKFTTIAWVGKSKPPKGLWVTRMGPEIDSVKDMYILPPVDNSEEDTRKIIENLKRDYPDAWNGSTKQWNTRVTAPKFVKGVQELVDCPEVPSATMLAIYLCIRSNPGLVIYLGKLKFESAEESAHVDKLISKGVCAFLDES